jgi:hypothetical protein
MHSNAFVPDFEHGSGIDDCVDGGGHGPETDHGPTPHSAGWSANSSETSFPLPSSSSHKILKDVAARVFCKDFPFRNGQTGGDNISFIGKGSEHLRCGLRIVKTQRSGSVRTERVG